jgi:hypothetical protein
VLQFPTAMFLAKMNLALAVLDLFIDRFDF